MLSRRRMGAPKSSTAVILLDEFEVIVDGTLEEGVIPRSKACEREVGWKGESWGSSSGSRGPIRLGDPGNPCCRAKSAGGDPGWLSECGRFEEPRMRRLADLKLAA